MSTVVVSTDTCRADEITGAGNYDPKGAKTLRDDVSRDSTGFASTAKVASGSSSFDVFCKIEFLGECAALSSESDVSESNEKRCDMETTIHSIKSLIIVVMNRLANSSTLVSVKRNMTPVMSDRMYLTWVWFKFHRSNHLVKSVPRVTKIQL